MDPSSAEATAPLFHDLNLPELGTTSEFVFPPHCLAPFRYVGIGDARSENPEPNLDIDVLRFDPTPDTTVIEPVRDILTGKIIDFKDVPVATVAVDDGSINRPVGSFDDYTLGSGAGVAFTPGGILGNLQREPPDTTAFLQALDTGVNLLTTPFAKASVDIQDSEQLPELPDGPTVVPTAAPRPTPQRITEASKTYAVIDTWDTSLFAAEVPNPALTMAFKLDVFQLRAIHRLELNQIVFVSAPTSAGKTVIAQYAIALSRAHKMRAIYTSPIKALSNQKFRDLSNLFGDVGILTGDVSINKEASCLIMTTEILRSMLYHGADMLRDIEVVIFDECHYISNDERGVVWEECIILLPHHINMVFLSATVPNAMEIADWIGRTKQRIVYVQEHTQRPVPLEHALYTGDGEFYVVSKPGKILDQNRLGDAHLSLSGIPGKVPNEPEYWVNLVLSAEHAKLLPMLIFCFEQRLCERLAENLFDINLLSKKDRKHVRGFCRKAILRLAKEDRDLPQIQTVTYLLENGVAFHHGGVLPIVKEMVEILLAEGYVKVLFCTSTFGMGLNVPARSCAFVSLRKFNGKEMAPLTPTEYVQMSGRAGRRGLDTVGTSIIICPGEIPCDMHLRNLFCGKVEALKSQFYLKFNMILNLMRVRDICMVDLLRRSLSANLTESMMPELVKKLKQVEKDLKALPKIDCAVADIEDMGIFGDGVLKMQDTSHWMMSHIDDYSILRQLQKGRVVYVVSNPPRLVAILENPTDAKEIKGISADGSTVTFEAADIGVLFGKPSKSVERMAVSGLREMLSKFHETPVSWAKIFATSDFEFVQAAQDQLMTYASIETSPCFKCPLVQKHLDIYCKKVDLIWERDDLNLQMRDESLAFKPLLDRYVNFLKYLEYVSADNVLLLKGRISIEINSCNEILATELLVNGVFDELHPAECASVASAFVSGTTTTREFDIVTPPALVDTFETIETIAKRVFDDFCEYGVPVENSWVSNNVNLVLAEPVLDWALGLPFKSIMQATDVPEGNVVRIINAVSEVLRDLSNAAKIMGCRLLADKFDQARELIKRDIIFAASLYFD